MGKKFKYVWMLLFAVSITYLLISVLQSGYHYTLDTDELYQAHYAYLLAHGVRPWIDMYISAYTPVFSWLLMPIFYWLGFVVSTIGFLRYLMITLYLTRIFFVVILARQLSLHRVGLLFIPLLLLDPFTTFVGMQIRPDNLMLLVYTIGLVLLCIGIKHRSKKFLLFAGCAFGASLVVFIKILPFLVVLYAALGYLYLRHRRFSEFGTFLFGSSLPVVAFLFYTLIQGSTVPMIQQVLIDPVSAFSAFKYPVRYGNFHWPDNIYIFGVMGTPPIWIYIWVLPWLAFAGAYHATIETIGKKTHTAVDVFTGVFAVSLVLYQSMLFFMPGVFIQYYLPLTWLYAYFAAFALDRLLKAVDKKISIKAFVVCILCVFYVWFLRDSYKNNTIRAGMTSESVYANLEKRFAQIPKDKAVFPNMLFRPLSHPVVFGYFMGLQDLDSRIARRYPSVEEVLDQKSVDYLILSVGDVDSLAPPDRDFITAHYLHVSGDESLMIRKKN